MGYTLRVLFRVGTGVLLLLVLLAGCSNLMHKRDRALRDVAANHGEDAVKRVDSWMSLRHRLQYASELTEVDKVILANDFFNGLPWYADVDQWASEDYWATPLETLLSNGGDCEDLAIAKYVTLLDGGIDEDRLRLTYVWHGSEREAHMVLAYYPVDGGEPLVLDNLHAEALALSDRADLEAVYSFNADKLWLADNPAEPVKIASQARLEKWRGVNERMASEAEHYYVL